ncbi:helix-turn-helix transcriptional regulator [Vagococcus sp. BWB3-3]|uniref:Helix-turn-helix transcriptional regulator n=1 Tax=Vagococcus allomyrinae TaxID=2794353 RepID=A0A940SW37_9ENTE|nr:helix-turn-helix transcriptional regulator [Vagococcus allomyrinae]MBP1040978.1 helix-turn-helix transcriptional regulator [Vagococcus allomyrinae]
MVRDQQQKELLESASQLLVQVRRDNRLTQEKLAEKMGVSAQTIKRMERGEGAKLDLVKFSKALEACGEQLVVSKKSKQRAHYAAVAKEQQIISHFREGQIAEANQELEQLKKWEYSILEADGRSLHEVGVALSLYFAGKPGASVSRLNKMLLGVALSGYKKRALQYQQIYLNTIEAAEKVLLQKEKGGKSDV